MRALGLAVALSLLALVIAAAGCTWEAAAIRHFENIEGKSLGLFKTANGNHYRRWGNEVPLVATLTALAVYAASATIAFRRKPGVTATMVSLWCTTILAMIAVWYFSALLGMNGEGVAI